MLVEQRRSPLPAQRSGSPGRWRVVVRLTGHSLRAFTRNPVAAFFTLLLPLGFLALVSAAVGNEVVGDGSGVRMAQLLVAPFAAFGVAYAGFVVLATDTAQLRETGVLKRWRGSPVPAWMVIASRLGSAVVVSLVAVTVLTVVGVAGYGVTVQWAKLPALLVTLLVGIACLAAIALALVGLIGSSAAVQAAANGILIPLAFISDIFLIAVELPTWLDRLGSALPLKHFVAALRETFDPSVAGAGFSPGHLAVLAAWTAGAAVVAWRLLDWEPRRRSRATHPGRTTSPGRAALTKPAEPAEPADAATTLAGSAATTGRPSHWALLRGQIWYAITGQRREPLAVFFAVIFPVLLLLLFPYVYGEGDGVRGLALAQFLLPAMMAWAIAVAGYLNLPDTVARSRERGVHKRLRGTPLPWHWYLAGQVTAALVVSGIALVLLLTVGAGVVGARVDAARLPAVAVTFLFGVACMAALGFALLTLIPSTKALNAVTLGTLLPLSFLSDIFLIGPEDLLPRGLTLIADVFPLKHLMHAMLTATRPDQAGAGFAFAHLAVIAAWTVAGFAVALSVRSRRR